VSIARVLALSCFGVYLAGAVSLHRWGPRWPWLARWWWLASCFLLGTGLVALSAAYLRWESVFFFVVGAWYLVLGTGVVVWLLRSAKNSNVGSDA
jgi:hypothetical protein